MESSGPTSGQSVAVIGAGAWGTALATVAHRARCKTIIRAHEPEVVEAINTQHINPDYLPGIPLDPAITATGDYAEAASADIILLATPAQFARATVAALAPHLADGAPENERPLYIAFSNTAAGIVAIGFMGLGIVTEATSVATTVVVLGGLAGLGFVLSRTMPKASRMAPSG